MMLNVAERAPLAPGVKVILSVVEPPGATVNGNVTGASTKSAALAPVTDSVVITRLPMPLLVMVIVVGELVVFGCWLANVTDAGLMLTLGSVPVPDNATVYVLLLLSVIVSVAVRLPTWLGVNVTLMATTLWGQSTVPAAAPAKVNSLAFPVVTATL